MDIETGVEDRQWYLLLTHFKQEERAYHNLQQSKVEGFNPKIKECRRNQFTGAPTYITQPLFPRYIFAKFNVRELQKVRFTRGVLKVVSFGNNPAVVHSDIIDIIRARIDQNGFVKVSNDPRPEDKVAINAEPLKNLIGIFEREVKGRERNMILLSAIEFKRPSRG
jgi:transcriptional antiterminator RfaH